MARIAGVDLPADKRIEIALMYIYGIGRSTARRILSATGVNADVRVKQLSEDDTARLRNIIERLVIMTAGDRIEVQHLPSALLGGTALPPPGGPATAPMAVPTRFSSL